MVPAHDPRADARRVVEPRVDTAETRWLYFASAGHRGATTPT